ncbi:M20 family peptidase [Gemmatimonadota bacterium]
MKKVLIIISSSMLVLIVVLLVRTAQFTSKQIQVDPAPTIVIDTEAVATRLAGALRFPTISYRDRTLRDEAVFSALNDYLINSFPLIHTTLLREAVGNHGLLYTWLGTEPDLKPILLMGHVDVVPVEPGTEGDWEYPPFSGRIADGHIWGRGAIDNKCSVLAILEAVEMLLRDQHQPDRTVFLAFGQDEEVGGNLGAASIVDLLVSRGVELEYVIDEGLIVLEDAPPLNAPVAMVGIAEKGYLSLALSVEGEGGHSSRPSRQTPVGILSSAIASLQDQPFPGGLPGPVRQYLTYVGPELPFFLRMVFANTWLFGGLIKQQFSTSPDTDAVLRTTIAPTMFEGSIKDNVLPIRANAVVNFRIIPGETIESVTERVQRIIDDSRISIEQYGDILGNPSPISSTEAPSFGLIHRTIRQIFTDAVVAPFLMMAATDSRYYQRLSENVYRFMPVRQSSDDLRMTHGTNERISIESYVDSIRFFRQLIINSNT